MKAWEAFKGVNRDSGWDGQAGVEQWKTVLWGNQCVFFLFERSMPEVLIYSIGLFFERSSKASSRFKKS
jgi:hypothetical protein